MKVREGYGFTLTELKQAGIKRREARGLGIKVDYRRRNLSEEGLKANVDRLNDYKARIIVFPRRTRRSVLRKKEVRSLRTGLYRTGRLAESALSFRARRTTLARTSASLGPTSLSSRSIPTPTPAAPSLSRPPLTSHHAPSLPKIAPSMLTRLFVRRGNGRRTPTSVSRPPRR